MKFLRGKQSGSGAEISAENSALLLHERHTVENLNYLFIEFFCFFFNKILKNLVNLNFLHYPFDKLFYAAGLYIKYFYNKKVF